MSTKETDIPTESTAATAPASKVEHFTPDERAARGKATRAEVPRRVHGEWEPPPHRPDPVVLLEELAVHVLPRRGRADGVRPRGNAPHRSPRTALR